MHCVLAVDATNDRHGLYELQVLKQLKRLRSLVGKGPLKLPEQSVDQLRSLLSMGAYPYLRVTLPRNHANMNLDDLSQIGIWRRQVVTENRNAQQVHCRVCRQCCGTGGATQRGTGNMVPWAAYA